MDLPIITIAILAVIAIVFIVALIKSFADAHWLHLVLILLTFATTIAGSIFLSRSYKTREAWQRKYRENERLLDTTKKAYELKRDGSPTSIASDINSVRGATSALQQETFGQGRVWSNGVPEKQGDTIVVTLPTVTAADNRGFVNEQPASQLAARMLVYVFRDGPIPDAIYNDQTQTDAVPLTPPNPPLNGPVKYLGIMQVVSVEGAKVTLKGSSTLDVQERKLQLDPQGKVVLQDGKPVIESTPIFPEIAQEFAAPSGTWTMFEKIPVDERDSFKRLKAEIRTVDPLSDTTAFDSYQESYRAELTQFMPPEIFGLDVSQPADAAKYEAIIDRYAFDQMRLTDINTWIENHKDQRVNQSFDPPTNERFVMLKFTAASDEYEVDSSTGNVRDNGAFDSQGRAVLNILWATKDGTGKIRLDEGAVVVVDAASANTLRGKEKVQDLGEVYVRQLNDYPALIANYNLERERLFDVMLRLVDEIEKLKITDADLLEQERQRTKLADNMTQDMGNLENDANVIEALRDQRLGEIVALKTQINDLHKVIGVRYEQIKQRSLQMLNTSR